MPSIRQGKYWLLTIPQHLFLPYLPPSVAYIKGQTEIGASTGYLHWQILCVFVRKIRLGGVKKVFGDCIHAEPSKSEAANSYVWKEDTAVVGTRFELGTLPMSRSREHDWELVWKYAQESKFELIPADIRMRYYGNIKRVAADNLTPFACEKVVTVLYGPTGTGKSRRAWLEAGVDAYPKDPRTKFWDGYRGQENVVIDEFRGGIDISHILRWLDRYPVVVEVKGSSVVLKAVRIWITSNLHPSEWYPLLDRGTIDALLRRMEVLLIN